MKSVTVSASRTYEVKIGAGVLASLGDEIRAVCKADTAAIISDTNVWPYYGDTAAKSLNNAGFRVVSFVFSAGEASKNGNIYLEILNFLAQNQVTRQGIWSGAAVRRERRTE